MPRNSSSSSSSGSSRIGLGSWGKASAVASKPLSYSGAAFQTPRAPVPLPSGPAMPAATAPAAAATPGFFANAWQGFGFGAGQSIAANIFRSDPKPATVVVQAPPDTTTTVTTPVRIPNFRSTSKEYVQCMEEAKQDKEACRHLLDHN